MFNFWELSKRRDLLSNDDQWDQWLLGVYMRHAGHTYAKRDVQSRLATTLRYKHSAWTHMSSLNFAAKSLDNSHNFIYDDP